jgi:hypothetical protein
MQIMAKESKEQPAPLGYVPISSNEQRQRLEPLMGLLASGDVPLDSTSARAIKTYIDLMDKQAR